MHRWNFKHIRHRRAGARKLAFKESSVGLVKTARTHVLAMWCPLLLTDREMRLLKKQLWKLRAETGA